MSSKFFVGGKIVYLMLVITKKFQQILKGKNLSQIALAKKVIYDDAALNAIILGKRAFPDPLLEKISKILEIPEEEFKSWIIADKYTVETLQTAIEELENKQDNILILTKNIDEILSNKGMSRTALSKMIGYSQSGLNRMIVGNESLSKSVIARIAPILEVSEEKIKGWFIAGKYDLSLLKLALKNKEKNKQ
jgi:transcriptional regulator with XRE-family HTH domain